MKYITVPWQNMQFDSGRRAAHAIRGGSKGEIHIGMKRAPLAYEEFYLKEHNCDGMWLDDIPNSTDNSASTVRHAMMDVVPPG